jgi:tetratricopeptide (TPR) repeat protein
VYECNRSFVVVAKLASIFCLTACVSAVAFSQTAALSECTRALHQGDYGRAERLATAYLEKNPLDVRMLIALGRAQLAQGELLAAFKQFRKALVRSPKDVDALYYMSFAARALSQQEYQKLLRVHPESSQVHELLAEAAVRNDNPAVAEDEFKKALQADPRFVEAVVDLAELKRSQSKFEEAITYYTQAAGLAPLSYDVAYGLGACYTYQHDYGQAVTWLNKAIRLVPDSAAAHFALGNALLQSDQLEAAIPELKGSLRLEPNMRQAYFLLGRAYTRLGRKAEADAAFRKLEELDRAAVPATQTTQP